MRNRAKHTAFCIAVAMCCTAVHAQTTQPTGSEPDDREQAEVRRTIIDYYTKVLTAADETELRSGFAGTDEAFGDVLLQRRAFVATQRAMAAVRKAFPDEAVNGPQSEEEIVKGIVIEFNEMPVKIQGDAATLGYSSDKSYAMIRKDGRWQVTDLLPDPESARQTLKSLSKLMTEAANEVEAGRYQSFQDFLSAMRAKKREMENATTIPTTTPSR